MYKLRKLSRQAYKLHLEGKIHKKKEASSVSGKVGGTAAATQAWGRGGGAFCDICDVSCSSKDAYEAHIRGIKHQKVKQLSWLSSSLSFCAFASD